MLGHEINIAIPEQFRPAVRFIIKQAMDEADPMELTSAEMLSGGYDEEADTLAAVIMTHFDKPITAWQLYAVFSVWFSREDARLFNGYTELASRINADIGSLLNLDN